MELSWNVCPYCGTPAANMRRADAMSMDDGLGSLKLEDDTGEEKAEG
jgi:hypothetical protein